MRKLKIEARDEEKVGKKTKKFEYCLQDAWKYKDEANLKILWFEDMKKDLVSFNKSCTAYLLRDCS